MCAFRSTVLFAALAAFAAGPDVLAQSLRVESGDCSLFFTPSADSASCSLSSFSRSGGRRLSVSVPAFVTSGQRRLAVRSVGVGDVGPFQGTEGLWRVSLPSSVASVTSFGSCPDLTSVVIESTVPPVLGRGVFSKGRRSEAIDTLRVPASAAEAYSGSQWGRAFSVIAPLYTFSFDRSGADGVVSAVASSPANFADLFFAYTDGAAGLTPRTPVSVTKSIIFPSLSVSSSDAKGLMSKLPTWPTVESVAAAFRGNSVSNLAAKVNGIFGSVKSGASVSNLVLDDAFLLVDPEDETFERSEDGRTLYVHAIAGRNHGGLTAVGFAGSVAMPKGAEAYGVEKYVVSLVGRQGRTGSVNGFLFLETPSASPRQLAFLTDCQGVGVDESLASKVALRKNPSQQAAKSEVPFNPDDQRFRFTSCYFSDQEFASGLVAYWLNFRGVGFSGDYKPLWRQGLSHPEAESNPAKALYKVDYQIDGESYMTSAPVFANGGDRVTVSYSRKPVTLTVGGRSVQPGEQSATFSYSADDVVAISWTRADFKPAERVREPGVEVNAKGSLITVAGAGKQLKELYTITGIKICETTGSTLSAPRRGAYSVRIGKRSWRVFVK